MVVDFWVWSETDLPIQLPVQNWLQAQAVRGFVKFLSLRWPRLLQTEDLWIPSSAEKAGAPTGTDTSRVMEQLSSTWHLPSANLECTGKKKFFQMLAWVCLCLGFWEITGLICFDSAFPQEGIYPNTLPSSHSASQILIYFPVLTVGEFLCAFYAYVCVCLPPITHIVWFGFIRLS